MLIQRTHPSKYVTPIRRSFVSITNLIFIVTIISFFITTAYGTEKSAENIYSSIRTRAEYTRQYIHYLKNRHHETSAHSRKKLFESLYADTSTLQTLTTELSEILSSKPNKKNANPTNDMEMLRSAMVLHEINSPITNANTIAHTLQEAETDIKRTSQYLDLIDSSLVRVKDIFFHLSTLHERGLSRTEWTDVDLYHTVENAIELHRQMAASKGIRIENMIPSEIQVEGNATLLSIVWSNLINNAIKFSKAEDDPIRITAKSSDDSVTISVRDFGTGMSPQRLEQLFSYIRQSQRGTGGEQGRGHGLTTVKKVVNAHGGKVSVSSTLKSTGSDDMGTEFTVTLWKELQ